MNPRHRSSAIPWPLRPIVKAPAPGTWGVGTPQGGRVGGSGDGPAPAAAESDWPLWKTAAVFGGLAVVLGPILFSIGLTSLTSRLAHEREAVTW